MAINPIQRKSRNSFLMGMVIMLLICAVVIGFLIYQMMGMKQTIAKKEKNQVCVLLSDVQSGAPITAEQVTVIKSEYAPSDALTLDDLNQNLITKTSLKAGAILSNSMLLQDGEKLNKDLRIQEYNMITLPSKLENGNYIDIRLTLPTGQDYLVVAKKRVIACDINTVWLELSEDEIVMMNNAIVESYIIKGANLYSNVYAEPGIQEKATPTYPVSPVVVESMTKNPNILAEAIQSYNNRVATNSPETDRQAIERILSQYAEDKKENVEEGVQASREKAQEKREQYIDQLNAF